MKRRLSMSCIVRGLPVSVIVLTGCQDGLVVENITQPDIDRVFATASAIEATIGTRFQSCHNAAAGNGGMAGNMVHLSAEGFGGLAISIIPRAPIVNGASGGTGYGDYAALATNGRVAADAVSALDRLRARGGTLGTVAQDLRARAFGLFGVGCHLGYLALVFDSAAITVPGASPDAIPPLSGAHDVMRATLAMLDSAIAVASDPSVSGTLGFPLPSGWAGGNALTQGDFIRLVRSLRARFRAGVARTPDERAAVDWPSVIADATNGLTGNLMISVGGSTGWTNSWASGSRNTLPYWYYGMADVSGAYDAWLATPLDRRAVFTLVTPDRRWPQGATRAAQQSSGAAAGTNADATPYIIHRTDEPSGFPWGVSYYSFRRLQYITNSGNTGAFPYLTKAELDLLAAEGQLRAGNIAAAATRIDVTRVGRGGLPALAGVITSSTQPVPGGASCVPRVPAPPAFTSTACGTIWEAFKWEKRMETAFTGYAQWFFDSRGWGDLIVETALEFPVPAPELNARNLALYTLGGGLASSAARGTYGF